MRSAKTGNSQWAFFGSCDRRSGIGRSTSGKFWPDFNQKCPKLLKCECPLEFWRSARFKALLKRHSLEYRFNVPARTDCTAQLAPTSMKANNRISAWPRANWGRYYLLIPLKSKMFGVQYCWWTRLFHLCSGGLGFFSFLYFFTFSPSQPITNVQRSAQAEQHVISQSQVCSEAHR